MTKKFFLSIAVFILSGLFMTSLLSEKSFAASPTPLPLGGTTFDNAVRLDPGKFITDHIIEADAYEFFKIYVASGQNLRIEMTTTAEGYGSMAIYDSYKKKQAEDLVIGDAFIVKDIGILANRSGDYYFSIGDVYETSEGTSYEISYQAKTPDDNLTSDAVTGTPSTTLTKEQITSMASNPDSVNWGSNWLLIIIVTAIVMVVSFLLFRKPGTKKTGTADYTETVETSEGTESTEPVDSIAPVSSSSNKENVKGKSLSPFTTCLIITFIALFGVAVSGISHNPVWVLIFLLPAVIYETIRTMDGATTKTSSIILLIVIILEIGMIIFNVNYNLADFFGEQEKYIAGYYLPLGDIKVFGPILVTVLSLILLIRTYGPYTKWLSIVIAIGALVAIYIINPYFFQNMLKIIVDAVTNQLGSYF